MSFSYAEACLELCEVFRKASSHKMRPQCFCVFVSVVHYLRDMEEDFEIFWLGYFAYFISHACNYVSFNFVSTLWKQSLVERTR
jgi:hypothetical protein